MNGFKVAERSGALIYDGALFKGKSTVVVGGGNAGLEGALELSEYVKDVTILEVRDELAADEFLIERAKNRESISIKTKAKPKRVEGDDFVNGLKFTDLESDEEEIIETDAIFVQVGSIPATDLLNNLVEYNEKGEVKIDSRTCQTATDGLFAAGDVTDVRDKQVVVATGEGCKALLSAYNYIKN